jgi:hypothetical protein
VPSSGRSQRNNGRDWHRLIREAWTQIETIAPNVAWHCVTDRVTFFLRNSTRDVSLELKHHFSPESLRTGDFSGEPVSAGDVPASFTGLKDLLKGTQSVVLDHTVPFMRLEGNSKIRTMIENELGRPLPPAADLTQGVLAWLCQRDDLRWISAFDRVSLLLGDSSQWVRSELGAMFAVRTVIEFGGGFNGVHPAVRFSVVAVATGRLRPDGSSAKTLRRRSARLPVRVRVKLKLWVA